MDRQACSNQYVWWGEESKLEGPWGRWEGKNREGPFFQQLKRSLEGNKKREGKNKLGPPPCHSIPILSN